MFWLGGGEIARQKWQPWINHGVCAFVTPHRQKLLRKKLAKTPHSMLAIKGKVFHRLWSEMKNGK